MLCIPQGYYVIGFYLFLAFEKLIMLFPHTFRKAVMMKIADLAYLIDGKHRRVILQNLHFAMGNSCTTEEEEQISRYCYRNLMTNFLQIMENKYLTKEKIENMVTIENQDIVNTAKESGRPLIFVTAHYGNWELEGAAVATLIMSNYVVHKALNNPYFEKYLHASRSNVNMMMVEKKGAVKQLAKALKGGGAISLLTDQNTKKRDGVVVNFFGKSARQTAAPAFLARKYNALILPVYITTKDDKNFTMRFEEAIEVSKTDNAEADILEATQKQADVLEKVIIENPKFWFWCHRRWKTEHPEVYRTSEK